jgi:hypothetical protein
MTIQSPRQTNSHASSTHFSSLFSAVLMFVVILLSIVANLFTSNVVYADSGIWTNIGTINTNPTLAFVPTGSTLYAGGSFTTVGGVSAARIAKWNGTAWSALGSGMNGTVRAITTNGSNVYAGGDFTTAGGTTVNRTAVWNGTSWASMNGNGADNTVYALAYSNNVLYVGGSFVRGGSTTVNGMAKVTGGTTWSLLGSNGATGGTATVYALSFASNGTTLYAGGNFTAMGGVSAKDIARWDGSAWHSLSSGMNNSVTAVDVDSSGNVYAGGAFTTAGGVSAPYIAKWNGSAWSALGAGVNGSVSSIFIDSNNHVYVGGAFTTAGGTTVNHIAMWDGSTWHSLGVGTSSTVDAIAVDSSGNPYAGGVYTSIVKYSTVAPPIANISQSPISSTWAKGNVTVTLDATGGASPIQVKYNINGGAWTSLAAIPQNVVMSSNGTINYELDDAATNVVTGSYSVTNIDTTPPTNPTDVSESNGATSDTWQSTVSAPNFTWTGAADTGGSGVYGYYVYWGTSSTGTAESYQTSSSYAPGTVTPGIYYLRIRTQDAATNTSAWATLFTLKYDSTAPTNPTNVSESHGVISDTWERILSAPSFTWGGAADTGGSGVAGYNVYWGTDSTGATGTYQTSSSYAPGTIISGAYYLRIQTQDNANNTSDWVTLFTFKYDPIVPTNPTGVSVSPPVNSGEWQSTVNDPTFTWTGADDTGGSGVAGYNVYWGTSSTGTTGTYQTSSSYAPGTVTSGIHYLRIQTKDNANNPSDWTTLFIFKYDPTAPTNPNSASESHSITNDTWQSTVNDPTFTWTGATDMGGSGVAGYNIYWGTDSNSTTGTYQTTSSYAPGTVTSGTYYLRIQTQDSANNTSAWATLFIFKYDPIAPSNPTATEDHEVANNTNQYLVNHPTFTFSGASDAGAGVDGYYVYWGTNASGTSTNYQTANSFDAGTALPGTYSLRVSAKDKAGNQAVWSTVFTFIYAQDTTPPTNPTSVSESHNVTSDTWQSTVNDPSFTWTGADDTGGSGVYGYNVYWGSNANGVAESSFQTTADFTSGTLSSGTYYLRLHTEDNANNISDWVTLFTFKYDSTAPTNPTASEDHEVADNTGQYLIDHPTFTFSGASDSGAGVDGYFTYWGSDSNGTSTDYQTATSFDPGTVTPGTYYLRVSTKDKAGNQSAWATVFTFILTERPLLSQVWSAESNLPNANLGLSVSSAGDINGDHYNDLIVGVPNYDNGQSGEGAVFVYYGSATGFKTAPDLIITGNEPGVHFGWSVSTAGDVNGDGFGDIIVGAPDCSPTKTREGCAYVYFGSAAGLDTTPAHVWSVHSGQEYASLGYIVGSAGHFNGNTYDDIFIGAPNYSQDHSKQGAVYVYFGSNQGIINTSASPDWLVKGDQDNAYLGLSASTAGDVNNDGFSDLIVGAPNASGDQTSEGKAYIYVGSGSTPSTTAAWVAEGGQQNAHFGAAVSSAGDVNGDGFSDVLIGAPDYDTPELDAGEVFAFFGSSTGLSQQAGWSGTNHQAGSHFGISVAPAGKVNADTYDDVIIGANQAKVNDETSGAVYLYYGKSDGIENTTSWTNAGSQAFGNYGYAAALAGDINGDGSDEIVVSAPQMDNQGGDKIDEGQIFLYSINH